MRRLGCGKTTGLCILGLISILVVASILLISDNHKGEKNSQGPEDTYDSWWDWLFPGHWKAILTHLCGILGIVLLLFSFCTRCIVPMLQRIRQLFTSTTAQYVAIAQNESDTTQEDPEDPSQNPQFSTPAVLPGNPYATPTPTSTGVREYIKTAHK
ncbi:hypothetical protein SKAU_G00138130 [Synaphobranchus kaupii]|uniref:Transmembrane protein n=1 Tax=Synaphobranchus kaupii TaxID=118154 RepID=A0A9Q1J1W6_SYNKA|nr:hypothetical protein SKAU_G00138130 [Synaphobranchus kaupii]